MLVARFYYFFLEKQATTKRKREKTQVVSNNVHVFPYFCGKTQEYHDSSKREREVDKELCKCVQTKAGRITPVRLHLLHTHIRVHG